jgi:hypothetical protein
MDRLGRLFNAMSFAKDEGFENNFGYDYVITVPREIIPAIEESDFREILWLRRVGPAATAEAGVDSLGLQGEA